MYKKSANLGNGCAMFNLGWCYRQLSIEGIMIDDPQIAVNLFKKSSKKGNIEALVKLGDMHEKGWYKNGNGRDRVPKNIPKAINYYLQAIELGNYKAILKLGRIYYEYSSKYVYFGDINPNFNIKNKNMVKVAAVQYAKNIMKIKQENIQMRKKIEKLEQHITHLTYKPDGPGYEKSKKDFIKLII